MAKEQSREPCGNAGRVVHVEYIILVRHGDRDKAVDVRRRDHHLKNLSSGISGLHDYAVADRDTPGRPASLSLAGWLGETLELYGVRVVKAVSSDHVHAIETVDAYLDSLRAQGRCSEDFSRAQDKRLNPEKFWLGSDLLAGPSSNWLQQIDVIPDAVKGKGNAVLVCGHQPFLTWLMNSLLARNGARWRNRLLGHRRLRPLPLRQSEAAFLRVAPDTQLMWAISAHSETITGQLRAKIRSKMDVAKFFAGFVSLLVGIIAGNASQVLPIWPACLVLALVLCIVTVFAYDRLLMPSPFWGGEPTTIDERIPKWTVRRPPSQVHWVLYDNMVRIWHWLFVPAVLSFLCGLGGLIAEKMQSVLGVGLIVLTLIVGLVAYRQVRPALGFDD